MEFIPGIQLSESFYLEIVKPLLQDHFPDLEYASALIGTGSEVQDFDDSTSMDHHWGVRVQLFLKEEDYKSQKDKILQFFRINLPYQFKGKSTNWSNPDPNDNNNQFPELKTKGEINHRIEIYTVRGFLKEMLGIISLNLSDIDWLLLPEQRLREITKGKVFDDLLGDLTTARKILSYFPDNVWFFKILSQWNKIAEEIAFPGRIGMQNDQLGGQIETSRLIRYAMVLCFILEKQYVPYPKWFSKAFSKLKIADNMQSLLDQALNEKDYQERDKILCDVYLKILKFQNTLGITQPLELKPKLFFTRPILVIDIDSIIKSLRKKIKPPLIRIKHPLGSIDQMIDYPNILSDAIFFKKLRTLYEGQ